MKNISLALSVALLAAGCASTQTAAPVGTAASGVAGATAPAKVATTATQQLDAKQIAEAKAKAISALKEKSVYFGFDKHDVTKENYQTVESNAQVIKTYGAKVLIQGNTDTRGSREYNLGLGQRRAESVKQSLVVIGVNPNQIEAVSLGKEKPMAKGKTESDHAKNRRADIIYQP